MARDVPAIPLFEQPQWAVVENDGTRTSHRTRLDPLVNAENWWLAELALAGAVAVALLAVSGAGGADAQTPKRGGTLVMGTLREPGCLNAYLFRCSSNVPPVGAIMRLAFRGAFRVGPDFRYQPDLLARAEYTTTPPYTLTFHIRRDARWSDGVPITARDFVFTHNAIRSVRKEMWEPDAAAWSIVRSTRAVDAKTVKVVLRGRFASWRGLFPHVLPAHALQGEDFSKVWLERLHDPRTGRPIGSGPFLVAAWERGHSVTFVRNPRYWKRQAHLERLVGPLLSSVRRSSARNSSSCCATGRSTSSRASSSPASRCVSYVASPGYGSCPPRGELGAHRHPDGPRRTSLPQAEAGSPRARVRDRPRRARSSVVRSGRLPLSTERQRDLSRQHHPVSPELECLPLSSRGVPEAARAGRMSTRIGRRLRLRGRAPLAAACDTRAETPAGSRRSRESSVSCGRPASTSSPCMPLRPRCSARSFRAAASTSRCSRTSPSRTGREFLRSVRLRFGAELLRLLPAAGQPRARSGWRILDAGRQAQVLNRADALLAKDVPVIPLYQNPVTAASRARVRNVDLGVFWDAFANAEDWWLAEPR